MLTENKLKLAWTKPAIVELSTIMTLDACDPLKNLPGNDGSIDTTVTPNAPCGS
jgi:hypothetical protein